MNADVIAVIAERSTVHQSFGQLSQASIPQIYTHNGTYNFSCSILVFNLVSFLFAFFPFMSAFVHISSIFYITSLIINV